MSENGQDFQEANFTYLNYLFNIKNSPKFEDSQYSIIED